MKKQAYIIGKALSCTLGKNKNTITKEISKLHQDNYLSFLEDKFKEKAFYSIQESYDCQKDKFFGILRNILDEAVKDAKLSIEDKKDFIPLFDAFREDKLSIPRWQFTSLNPELLMGFESLAIRP